MFAVAMCTACGGSAVAPPGGGARANLSAPPRYAKFEYVINDYGSYASIFDYPNSDLQIGRINNVGGQGCTNVLYGYGKKMFWIVAGSDRITEYEIPRKHIKTLSDSVGVPSSCAMNGSGDQAVGILFGSGSGDVVIFRHASGKGNAIATPLFGEYFDGYDPEGNLFADGFTGSAGSAKFGFVELPKGGKKFRTIATSNPVKYPGSVQWDGKYLTVGNQEGAIYRYTISRTKATLRGTVHLRNAGICSQTWIVEGLVYCAAEEGAKVFKYPAGGPAIAVFKGDFDLQLGVTAAQE